MKKAVIFDLDGTLLDTLSDLTDSVNATLSAFHKPHRREDEVASFVGNGVRKLIERAFGEAVAEEVIDAAFSYFMDYYGRHASIKTKPYRGVPECLNRLKENGYTLLILSNKADAFTKELAALYFPEIFTLAEGQKDGVKRKPAPDAVFHLLNAAGVKTDNAVFVGDSDVDILTAKNAGLLAVAVLWGLRTKEVLLAAGATHFAQTGDELYREITAIL